MSVKNFSNTVDLAKMGIDKMKSDIADLVTVVGDEDSGLVKSVSDLETVVGDEDSGLVKQINDLDDEIDNMHKFYSETYESSGSPISVTFDLSDINIGLETVLDIYPNIGVTVTSYSLSGTTLTVVIPAQNDPGNIIVMVTNSTPAQA